MRPSLVRLTAASLVAAIAVVVALTGPGGTAPGPAPEDRSDRRGPMIWADFDADRFLEAAHFPAEEWSYLAVGPNESGEVPASHLVVAGGDGAPDGSRLLTLAGDAVGPDADLVWVQPHLSDQWGRTALALAVQRPSSLTEIEGAARGPASISYGAPDQDCAHNLIARSLDDEQSLAVIAVDFEPRRGILHLGSSPDAAEIARVPALLGFGNLPSLFAILHELPDLRPRYDELEDAILAGEFGAARSLLGDLIDAGAAFGTAGGPARTSGQRFALALAGGTMAPPWDRCVGELPGNFGDEARLMQRRESHVTGFTARLAFQVLRQRAEEKYGAAAPAYRAALDRFLESNDASDRVLRGDYAALASQTLELAVREGKIGHFSEILQLLHMARGDLSRTCAPVSDCLLRDIPDDPAFDPIREAVQGMDW